MLSNSNLPPDKSSSITTESVKSGVEMGNDVVITFEPVQENVEDKVIEDQIIIIEDIPEDRPIIIDNEESDEESNNEALNEDIPPYDACCVQLRPLRPLLYAGPITIAITEAADVAMSLAQSNNTNIGLGVVGGSIAFAAGIGLNGKAFTKNFKVSLHFMKKRELPEDWPKLSTGQEGLAIMVSILPILYGIFSKAAQSYYFIIALPNDYHFENSISPYFWIAGSGIFAIVAGGTIFLTESAEMYKTLRNRLAGESTPYSNAVSKFVSPIFGGSLAVLQAFQNSAEGYVAIKSIFKIESLPGLITVGSFSIANAFPYFCFVGLYSINAIDEFLDYLQEMKEKMKVEPKKVTAFSLSLTLAIGLAILKRPLNQYFYQNVTGDFGVNNTETAEASLNALSWTMAVQETILVTASLHAPMYSVVNGVCNKVSSAASSIYSAVSSVHHYFYPLTNEDIDEIVNEPLLLDSDDEIIDIPSTIQEVQEENPRYYQDNNMHLTFNNFRRIREEAERRKEEKKGFFERNCPSFF